MSSSLCPLRTLCVLCVKTGLLTNGIHDARVDAFGRSTDVRKSNAGYPHVSLVCRFPVHPPHWRNLSRGDRDLIDGEVRVADTLTSPLLGKIELLDAPYGMCANPYFNAKLRTSSVLADHDAQCFADVVTNHAVTAMYHGWKTINGKTYVMVRMLPKWDEKRRT